MEFGLSNFAVLITNRVKFAKSDGILMPDREILKSVENDGVYKYPVSFEADGLNHKEIKDSIKREYIIRKILKLKRDWGKKVSATIAQAVPIIRSNLDWTEAEL